MTRFGTDGIKSLAKGLSVDTGVVGHHRKFFSFIYGFARKKEVPTGMLEGLDGRSNKEDTAKALARWWQELSGSDKLRLTDELRRSVYKCPPKEWTPDKGPITGCTPLEQFGESMVKVFKAIGGELCRAFWTEPCEYFVQVLEQKFLPWFPGFRIEHFMALMHMWAVVPDEDIDSAVTLYGAESVLRRLRETIETVALRQLTLQGSLDVRKRIAATPEEYAKVRAGECTCLSTSTAAKQMQLTHTSRR